MNSIMQDYWPVFELYQAIRGQILAVLTDEDLAFSPGGANPALGELCREIGETEHAYIESFRDFTCDFSYRRPEPELASSVARLGAWYAELDEQLKAVIESLSEEQLQSQRVVRGPNFALPPRIQLNIYQEALLIFYGKASVYLKALSKPMPEQMKAWIA
jgi:hypothetical protein